MYNNPDMMPGVIFGVTLTVALIFLLFVPLLHLNPGSFFKGAAIGAGMLCVMLGAIFAFIFLLARNGA